MNDNQTKLILIGILLSLLIIALRPAPKAQPTIVPPTNAAIEHDEAFIQIAPNIIGVKDDGTHSGIRGQLLVFEYDNASKSFAFRGALNYEAFVNHPEKYGIAVHE